MIKTSPDPSLCDSCKNAINIIGGSSAITFPDGSGYDCPQRYCSVSHNGDSHIAIHFKGKQKCDSYEAEEKVPCPPG